MNLKSIKIGNLHTKNNVFLAPLAGYTNAVFRKMCYDLGAGLTYTEMVSARGLVYGNEKTEDLLYTMPDYGGIRACQLFGNDPEIMRGACESEALKDYEIVDINMGCPVPKIFKNGEGSALMGDIPLAAKIISECKKSGKIITVKFRTGLDERHIVGEQFAKTCEDSGADAICIHGRTRDKMYSGEVDFEEIARAKAAVKIPVIANGGVFCRADFENLLKKTGADGAAVARGAMYNPWVFAEITGVPAGDKKAQILRQLDDTQRLYGERFACVYMRKMAGFYIKGMRGASALKERLFRCATCADLKELLKEIEF